MLKNIFFITIVLSFVFLLLKPTHYDILSVQKIEENTKIEYSLVNSVVKNEDSFDLSYINESCDDFYITKKNQSLSVLCYRKYKRNIELHSRDFKDLFSKVNLLVEKNESNKHFTKSDFFKTSFNDILFTYQLKDNNATLKTNRRTFEDSLPIYVNKINFFIIHALKNSELVIQDVINTENRLLKNKNDYNNTIS
jgi:hypothetical protein